MASGAAYADKAYINADWAESLEKDRALTLLTPRKRANGDVLISGDTFSTFVSPPVVYGVLEGRTLCRVAM